MRPQTLVKQPDESRVYRMNFAGNLEPGETLSTLDSVTAVPADELTLTETSVSGPSALVRITDGEDGTKYKVTFVVTTSAGNVLEGEGYLQVTSL